MIESVKSEIGWGGDVIAMLLRELGCRFVSLSPGSSFRGLHESIVNLLDNRDPEIILCLHEEHAVSIAHGYAKVTGEPMGVLVHANVGLMHASMGIYNAFCDRVPMLVMGGSAPLDAGRRISPAHWHHTVLDQGDLVRDFVKWDDQPLSIRATVDSLLRAWQITKAEPAAPVYLTLDQRLQEDPVDELHWPDVERYRPPAAPEPPPEAVEQAARLLVNAEQPLILMGRVGHDPQAWNDRVRIAEVLGADVLTDLKVGAAFPTEHPLHAAEPQLVFTNAIGMERIRQADIVLNLDWVDVTNLFRRVWQEGEFPPKIIRCSADRHLHNGWSREHQPLSPADIDIMAGPGRTVPALLAEIERIGGESLIARAAKRIQRRRAEMKRPPPVRNEAAGPEAIGLWDIGTALKSTLEVGKACVVRLPLGWHATALPFRAGLDYLGYDGAGGIGSGPGMAVGAALGLRGSNRLPVVILGDGDYLMGVTALWTASHHDIPLLVVIANNQSYYVDEEHQRLVSRQRNRPVERAWIGQRIENPEVDLLAMGAAQGFKTVGPVLRRGELDAAIRRAAQLVRKGGRCVVDVRIVPDYQGLVG
jgi:thiamine pyrophosphate-dependent acetolactate synthase large subunit-like protein